MNLRNMSRQPFLIHIMGRAVTLFSGRAVTLTDEELKSPQVQSLIAGGLARIEKPVPAQAAKGAKADTAKHDMEKHEKKKAGT